MVVPIGDAPNPRGTPFVTYGLIAVNVAVYLLLNVPLEGQQASPADPLLGEYLRVMSEHLRGRVPFAEFASQVSAYDLFVFAHGFRPGSPSVATLFEAMFLHAGFAHLAGNMLFLWIYGDNVEQQLGPARYLGWYLATGVAATLCFAAGAPSSQVPMIGASGAISGVLGFYFLWFPRNQVRLLWLFPPFFMRVIEVPARFVLGAYLVLDNLIPYLLTEATTGVAHGAHIGGFLAGLGAAWVMDRRRRGDVGRVVVEDEADESPARSDDPAAVATAAARGQMGAAAASLLGLSPAARRGVSPADVLHVALWLREHGRSDAALVLARRHLHDCPRGPLLPEMHVLAGAILLEDENQPTPAYQHFLAALDLEPAPEVAAAARRGLEEIAARQKRQIGRLAP